MSNLFNYWFEKQAKSKKKFEFEEISRGINKDGKRYGCSVGKNEKGFFVYTHRARSKYYSVKDKIPKSVLKWIESTG